MSIINSVSLFLLRSKIKKRIRSLDRIQDTYDCGNQLMEYLNPKIPQIKEEIKSLKEKYDELEKIRKETIAKRSGGV